MYEERLYRNYAKSHGLISFTVIDQESDLFILASNDLTDKAKVSIRKYREQIKTYGEQEKNFITSLVPMEVRDEAPKIIKEMAKAAKLAGVGPMATVAGAVSEYVGKELLAHTEEILIENGGDIFIKSNSPKKILVHAGQSPFSEKIALAIAPEDTPVGICTSAGTIGHSLSFGKADAVVVISKNTLLADATATALGNMVKEPKDIQQALEYGNNIDGIDGILIIIQDKMGAWGKIEIVEP